ncbi:MAG: hypothetical protein IPL26_28625 [Leptospiraceae bacterium]|nr:hypothetical protein [Leptospiraceae bacterium]
MKLLFYFILALTSILAQANTSYLPAIPLEEEQFISFGKIPTWKGVTVSWKENPKSYFCNQRLYPGHTEFISKALGKNILFHQFEDSVRYSTKREYMAFYVYDLRSKPYRQKGKSFDWALKIQDYGYDDSPAQMSEEIKKLAKSIYLELAAKGFQKEPLIIVNNDKKNLFYEKTIGKFLQNKGILQLNDLIQYFGGSGIEVLNKGETFGILKFIEKEEEIIHLNPDEIAVLNFMPDQVPPVAGIITLVPQPPLSHVNLLARNRGTINISMSSIESYPGLKNLANRKVYIKANKEEFEIQEVKEEEYLLGRKIKNTRKNTTIPEAKTDINEIISLSGGYEKFYSPEHIGTKAANYSVLYRLCTEIVRPGFAVGFQQYFNTIKGETEDKINSLVSTKDKSSREEIRRKLLEIRESILKSKLSTEFKMDLINNLRKNFPNKKIRLRSSTNSEDLPAFNGAGLYKSQGFHTNDSEDILEKKILEVHASLWSEKAFLEREYFGIEHTKVGMALLINESFQKEIANGVILTSPLPDYSYDILINSQSGEESVTNPSGKFKTEYIALNPNNRKIQKIYSRSSIKPIFLGNLLNQKALRILSENTVKLHTHFLKLREAANDNSQYGVDIEFKILKGKKENEIYFKQVRLLKF